MTATKTLLQQSTVPRQAVRLMGRLGYAARGTVYFMVGFSAAMAALRPERRLGGMTDALKPLQHDWAGVVLLALLTVGVACLAGWFAVVAMSRRDHTGATRIMIAAAMLGDAAVYIGFVVIMAGVVVGAWPHSSEYEMHWWTAWLMSFAYGRILVGVAGALVTGCGVGLFVWSVLGRIEGSLTLPPDERRLVRLIGRYGVAGRGAAVALIGCYLFVAAVHGKPGEAHELGGMLTALRAHDYGVAAIALFAAAFIASSFLDFMIAGFRRFDPKRPAG